MHDCKPTLGIKTKHPLKLTLYTQSDHYTREYYQKQTADTHNTKAAVKSFNFSFITKIMSKLLCKSITGWNSKNCYYFRCVCSLMCIVLKLFLSGLSEWAARKQESNCCWMKSVCVCVCACVCVSSLACLTDVSVLSVFGPGAAVW